MKRKLITGMIVCKEYACITRTVLINSPTMQQEFLSTKVHHKLLKESKIFNACFFCMHANMMGYFFLDFILTTFFTLGHSIPSTSSISRYDVQWLCEVAPSFVYQVTPHLKTVLCAKIQILESVILMRGGGIL